MTGASAIYLSRWSKDPKLPFRRPECVMRTRVRNAFFFPVTEVIDWQSDLLPVDRNAAVRSTPNAHAVHFGELCQ